MLCFVKGGRQRTPGRFQNHGNWKRRGSLTMRSRVNAKVRELLESHKPEPLPTDLDAWLSSLISGAEGAARRSEPPDHPRRLRPTEAEIGPMPRSIT
jgi:hypothetical protein